MKISFCRLATTLAFLLLITGCVTPITAAKKSVIRKKVSYYLNTPNGTLDYHLLSQDDLTKEQIAEREKLVEPKLIPFQKAYDDEWCKDREATLAQVIAEQSSMPLVGFEERTRTLDQRLTRELASIGLKGTNLIQFSDGKMISRIEYVRNLKALVDDAIRVNASANSERETSFALVSLLGAFAGAAGSATNPDLVPVSGYIKKDGTYVPPYVRTAPNGILSDNLSY